MEIKIIQAEYVPLSMIKTNDGQIDGVPANPRCLVGDEFDKLCKSIKDNPEMLSLRELLVYPYDGEYVVIGGNMRLQALRYLRFKDAPCKVLDPDTPKDVLIEIIVKDNVTYGDWSEDLKTEWNPDELDDWGVIMTRSHAADVNADKANEGTISMTFVFSSEQFKHVKQRLNAIDKDDNANAVLLLIQEYNESNEGK